MAASGEERCPHAQEATVSGTSNGSKVYELKKAYMNLYIYTIHYLVYMSCYQLCYVDPGIASSEEMEQLKTIDSMLVRF
jgi:zinc finger-containing ubiquitin peptidase 1